MDFGAVPGKTIPSSKVKVEVENVAQAYLELLSLRGIEYCFVNSGTDYASIEDAFARRKAQGKRFPRPLAIPHEVVAVSMAFGYYQITGRPQVAMVHVGVGTVNGLGAIIAASKGRIPILFSAGRTPLTEEGSPASRNRYIHWGQEYFDQAGMLREFVKWDYELRMSSHLESVVDRALTLAMTEPRGPVYLVLPREVVSAPLERVEFQTKPRFDLPAVYPDPAKIEEAANLLAQAEFPILITAASGRDPDALQSLIEFSEAAAVGVICFNPEYLNFPTDHPHHLGFGPNRLLAQADLVLVADCDVPWYPAEGKPKETTAVIQIGIDPLYQRYPLRSFPSDLTLQGRTAYILRELARLSLKHPARNPEAIRSRSLRMKESHDGLIRSWEEAAQKASGKTPLHFEWVSHCVNSVLDEDAILVNEYDMRLSQLSRRRAGTYFAHPHAGYLGWGVGAALGMKLAASEKTVVMTAGDGAYLFSVPSACHFVAAAHQLPILLVVFNNQGYGAAKAATRDLHPGGWADKAGEFPLCEFPVNARYEKICEAFGGYGERVEDPDQLIPALRRGLHAVRDEKRQALINVVCERL